MEIKYKKIDLFKRGLVLEFMEIIVFGKKIYLGRNLEVMVWVVYYKIYVCRMKNKIIKNICMLVYINEILLGLLVF